MRIFKWLGAAFVMLLGLFWASTARRHKQRGKLIIENEARIRRSEKSTSIVKASKLGEKADVAMEKARQAQIRSRELQHKLESENEKSLADRVRDFNNRV